MSGNQLCFFSLFCGIDHNDKLCNWKFDRQTRRRPVASKSLASREADTLSHSRHIKFESETSRQRAALAHTQIKIKKGRAERKEREKMKYQRLQMTTQSSLPFQTLTECKTSDIICVSLSTVTQSRDRKTMASSVQNKNKNEIISFTAKKIKEREKFFLFFSNSLRAAEGA
jgi:hypothetical protein